ncbi:putative nuclease HARBI1 [Ixodes scapularis]
MVLCVMIDCRSTLQLKKKKEESKLGDSHFFKTLRVRTLECENVWSLSVRRHRKWLARVTCKYLDVNADKYRVCSKHFISGDSGYPLEPWLITPVPGNHATSTACGRFNKAHSSIRSVVERCIGLLKNRFRCLQRHRALYYHPSTATAIISACAVLHNICLASSESEPESDSDPEESELESEPSSDGSEPSSERSASAPERLAPAGPPVGLPVGLSDRGKALRQRLVARFGTRRRLARAERHTQGVRRHDGSPDHQGHRRKAPQRPRGGGAQHGRRQRQGTSRHHD